MKRSLLLVDDNQDACRSAATLIAWSGDYDVDFALDCRTALQLVQAKHYALAIIDYQLPGMNGIELFQKMREICPHIKSIFVTGYADSGVVFPALEAGVLQVLAKPVNFIDLIPVIDQHTRPD